MKYTYEQQMEILTWARDKGVRDAAKVFSLPESTIVRWNARYHVYEKQELRKFSVEQKTEILQFAQSEGILKASRRYDIGTAIIRRWASTMGVYTQTGRKKKSSSGKPKARPSVEQIKQILTFAKVNGVSETVRQFNVGESTIRYWNKRYKIFETRTHRVFDDALRHKIIQYADVHGMPEAGRRFDVTTDQISQWIESERRRKK